MRQFFPFLLLLAGCENQKCIETTISTSISLNSKIQFYEGSSSFDRPDEVRTGTGRIFSGSHNGGRLVAAFDGPVVGGTLPRFVTLPSDPCTAHQDRVLFFDGVNFALDTDATVTVTDAGVTLESIQVHLPDGGTQALAARSFEGT